MVTQEERNAIAELYSDDDIIGTLEDSLRATLLHDLDKALQQYRTDRGFMLAVKQIGFPYDTDLAQAIQARKEWSEASKRVRELEK